MGDPWKEFQEQIRIYYLDENKPLKEVMALMESHHNFTPSKRTYNTKLKQWGYLKKKLSYSAGRRHWKDHPAVASRSNSRSIEQHCHRPTPQNDENSSTSDFQIVGPSSTEVASNPQEPTTPSALLHTPLEAPPPSPNLVGPESVHAILFENLLRVEDKASFMNLNRSALLNIDSNGDLPLHISVKHGDLNLVKWVIEYTPSTYIDTQNKNGLTPLHIAAKHSSPEVLKQLDMKNPALSPQDYNGDTPLHLALGVLREMSWKRPRQATEATIVSILLEAGADVNIVNSKEQSPFYLMLKILDDGLKIANPLKLLQAFVNASADTLGGILLISNLKTFLWNLDHRWRQPQSTFVKRDLTILWTFLDKGADPDALLPFNDKVSNLRTDTAQQSARTMGMTICSPEAPFPGNQTPFQLRAENVISGVPPSMIRFSHYYLSHGVKVRNDPNLVSYLCKHAQQDVHAGRTLLQCIVDSTTHITLTGRGSLTTCIEMLLERGSDPNIQDKLGDTPLMTFLWEACEGSIKASIILPIVEAFLKHGANALLCNKAEKHAVSIALCLPRTSGQDVLKLLLGSTIAHRQINERHLRGPFPLWLDHWKVACWEFTWDRSLGVLNTRVKDMCESDLYLALLRNLASQHLERWMDLDRSTPNVMTAAVRLETLAEMANIFLHCKEMGIVLEERWSEYIIKSLAGQRDSI